MLSKEILEVHYLEYANQSDEWVENMEITKRSIIERVVKQMQFRVSTVPVKVVVLGASDRRYVDIHERVFTKVLGCDIEMITFDIDPVHLGGESNKVILHDTTKLFPGAPFDIVFSHELMKFLTPQEQLQTIENSYKALGINGLAMHIIHEPSIKGTSELRSWQYRVNPDELIQSLHAENIPAVKLEFESESDVAWLRETTVIAVAKK